MKFLFTTYPKVGATLSIGGTLTSFITSALPAMQLLGVASGIFIAWYTFYLQQKNKKNNQF